MAASPYPLAMLIGVCKLREDAAASAVRVAERNRDDEKEAGDKLRRELEEYKVWRREEENRRYKELFDKESDREDLESFRIGIASLKDREVEYEGMIIESDRRLAELEVKVEEAKRVYMAALQETMKIDAHREMWMEDWNREQGRLEDVEMEEFTGGAAKEKNESEAEELEAGMYVQ